MDGDDDAWRPSASWETLRTRARLLGAARAWFAARNILEVDTPVLGLHGVTEPNIASIAVRVAARPDTPHFLQTSPEYAMKRLLAAGAPDLYQLGKVFRDGELGRRHQPEFTMAEWYRRGLSLDEMIAETCDFITHLLSAGGRSNLAKPPQQSTYSALFLTELSIDPLTASPDALRMTAQQRIDSLPETLIPTLGADRAAWLDLLLSHIIIPGLPTDTLFVIHHYPAGQAALARPDPKDPRCAERFEVFFNGLELANGYRELTDADEQRRRFLIDQQRRSSANAADMEADPALLAALDHGLPDCSGVAVGFDRVLMCALGLDSITDAVSFPL